MSQSLRHFSKVHRASALVIFSLLNLWIPALAKGNLPSVHVTVLTQKHDIYGSIKVIISPHAVRVEAPDRDNLLIAKGPLYRVEVYNTKTKRAMQMGFPEFICHAVQATYLAQEQEVILPSANDWKAMVRGWQACNVPAGEIELLGRACDAYWVVEPRHHNQADVYYIATCDVLKNVPVDEKAVFVIEKFLYSETGFGIPVRYRRRQYAETKNRYGTIAGIGDYISLKAALNTKAIADSTEPLSSFEYLKGYAHVNREIDLLDDGKPKASLEELFGPEQKK